MTLPPSYSWFPRGARLRIPYEAAQGRRVNAIGAYVTHGPRAGHLEYQTWAALPKSRAKTRRTSPEERAAAQGLQVDDVGPIDAERFVAFIWQVARAPPGSPGGLASGAPSVDRAGYLLGPQEPDGRRGPRRLDRGGQ